MATATANGAPRTNGVTPKVNGAAKSASRFSTQNLPSHFIGGNHLDAAPSSKVKDFVIANNGHTVITSVRYLVSTEVSGRANGSKGAYCK